MLDEFTCVLVFFTTTLYDFTVGVVGVCNDVVVLLFSISTQIENLWLDDRIDTTAGTDCDSRSNFSAAALATMSLSAGT